MRGIFDGLGDFLMRILHTADWHLGQRFFNKSREEEEQFYLNWLVDTLKQRQIDVLIVAGDVFDVANPPNSALGLYYRFLLEVSQTCCRHVVIVGGNHDGVSTLNAPKELLEVMNIHVVGGFSGDIDDEIITIGDDLVVVAVPFLRERDLEANVVAGESYDDRIRRLRDGILSHYEILAEKVAPYRKRGIPVIATGHLYAAGGIPSDSGRDIHLGNLAQVNFSGVLDSFDYIALGHLHRPQCVGKEEKVCYSGSLWTLSFSERKDEKQVVVVDLPNEITKVSVPCYRRLKRFKGPFEEVVEAIENYQSYTEHDWCEVILEMKSYDPLVLDELRKFLANNVKNVEVLKYSIEIVGDGKVVEEEKILSLKELSEYDVFQKMLSGSYTAEQKDLLRHSFNDLLEWMADEDIKVKV